MNLIGSYNYALVALSVLIAIVAAYAALDLAARVTAATGWTRAIVVSSVWFAVTRLPTFTERLPLWPSTGVERGANG